MTRVPRFGLVPHRSLFLACAALALAACGSKDAAPAAPGAPQAPAAAADTAAPAPARTGRQSPRDAVDEVMARFLDARSYHVNMDTQADGQAMTIEMDFVAPDRYRMQTPAGTQHVIGDTMYMTMGGRTQKLPMSPGQMSQFQDSFRAAEKHRATMTVEAQGSEPVDGKSTRKYVMRNTRPEPSESTLWIGDDGYPVQVVVNGQAGGKPMQTMIRYSRFNDPTIRIDPPQ